MAAAAQKKRDEVERLKNEIRQLEVTRKKLSDSAKALAGENGAKLISFLSGQQTCMSGAAENRVLLTPVLGHEYAQKELAEQLRLHMNQSGFSLSDDEAMSLLIGFSLYDTLCFCGRTMQDAQQFAKVLLESFGLQSVSAAIHADTFVEMVSMLEENGHRTPTVTVQPIGTETMTVFGHKTIYLADASMMPAGQEGQMAFPVVQVPSMLKRVFAHGEEWQPVQPASLSSFSVIRADSHPMLTEAEKWFGELRKALETEHVTVSDTLLVCMRRFIEVASRKVRGGFLAAADIAVCHWIVPVLLWNHCDRSRMLEMLSGLPRAMEQLGIR